MGKGLPRSLGRGAPFKQDVVKQLVKFTKSLSIANGSSADGFGTVVIGDLPAGKIALLATRVRNTVFSTADADATATWNGHIAIGSAPATDVTVTGTKGDLVASTVIGAATAKVSPVQDIAAYKGTILDNTDGSLEINLNVLVDDASQAGVIDMNVTGILELVYTVL